MLHTCQYEYMEVHPQSCKSPDDCIAQLPRHSELRQISKPALCPLCVVIVLHIIVLSPLRWQNEVFLLVHSCTCMYTIRCATNVCNMVLKRLPGFNNRFCLHHRVVAFKNQVLPYSECSAIYVVRGYSAIFVLRVQWNNGSQRMQCKNCTQRVHCKKCTQTAHCRSWSQKVRCTNCSGQPEVVRIIVVTSYPA